MNYGQLPFPENLWEHRFGFFWYNDPEIFEWTEMDFDRKAKEFADSGINHVITFSVTHFRWSFHPYWNEINATIKKIVDACHRYGIYVTEHHSAVFMFRTETPEREELMLKRFSKRNSSPAHWPEFLENTQRDIIVEGTNISDMAQVDPATGKRLLFEEYASYIICHNNPGFLPLYLKYLESVYQLGVDGIMTDDITMTFSNYDGRQDAPDSCACEYCRSQFKEESGHDLPESGAAWIAWRRERTSPAFIAWMKFREASVRKCHEKISEHYKSLGLSLLRPNYSATCLFWTNPGGYCFDLLADLHWAFTENTFEHIIRYSWTEWIIEHNHRFALARHRMIPAMAMYYPDREDTVRFCWAISLNSGMKYLGTTHDSRVNHTAWEKDLRRFEKDHADSLDDSRKLSSIAFYFSRNTRDLYPEYEGRSRESQTAWMLACELENIPYDMLLPEEIERIDEYKVLILHEAAIMSKYEIEKVRNFVRSGGKTVWLGKTGSRDEDFSSRSFHDIWGIEEKADEHSMGAGTVVALNIEDWSAPLRRRVGSANRWDGNHAKCFEFKPLSKVEMDLHRRIRLLVDRLLPDGSGLKIENAPRGLLFHPFLSRNGDHIALHYVNTIGTLDLPDCGYVTHNDRIPFPHCREKVEIQIRKPKVMLQKKCHSSRLFIPGKSPIELAVKDCGDFLAFTLTPDDIDFYGLIKFNSAL